MEWVVTVVVLLVTIYALKSYLLRILRWTQRQIYHGVKDVHPGASTGLDKFPVAQITPLSVNYFPTRRCNYKCGFCFHTAKTSFVLPLDEAKRGLKNLKDAGMEKMNFSGGEPFIEDRGHYVGQLVRYCKEDLRLPSVSIISNGSLIKGSWFVKYGEYLDILAISCDSFNPETNELIGRYHGRRSHLESLERVRNWCREYKVFQCLVLEGENAGEDALRNAANFVITETEFEAFLTRHQGVECLVPESNEKMRFLDCRDGSKIPSRSILDVGVENALVFSGFDEEMFFKRGGVYMWSKADMKLDW